MPRNRPPRAKASGGAHHAGPGTMVRLAYELFDAEGESVERSSDDAPLELLLGYGIAPPALEQALEGQAPGAERDVILKPGEAFGERDPEAVIEVARSELPPDVVEGDELEADRDEDDEPVVLKVLEVRDDAVVLDTNHPLSGQKVRLRVRLLSVRPASSAELEAATEALLSEEEALVPEAGPGAPLLPVERLLKRGRESSSLGVDELPVPPPPKRLA